MTGIVLRPAVGNDMTMLFDWVNRADSLAQKRRTAGPIAEGEHRAWFARALADPSCRLWIVERGGVALGQVRLQGAAEAPEIDVYVTAAARGAGVARAAVAEAIRRWRGDHPGARPRAWVNAGNNPSLALFGALGFKRAGEADGYVCLVQAAP